MVVVTSSDSKDTCKWYECCPLKEFHERGELDEKWIEEYCKGDYEDCVRYQKEEKGIPHPDNLLPDGSIREDLKTKWE